MRHLRFLPAAALICTLLAGGLSLHAQGRTYSADQINQIVAPVALYPDALMSQVFMAATFPDQVADADQWVQANRGLTGRALDDALATATWDPSIIALCKFPSALDRMAQNIAWTTDLGNAFLYQRTDVMDAVQVLRSEAYRNGHLRTTEQQRVVVQGPDYVIQPYTPDVIYVPVYQPAVVYGAYWNYPTYYYPGVWNPWPGFSFVDGFAWGLGFTLENILFGGCDWGHRDVFVNNTVITNCSIYHNSPYYTGGYSQGGYDRQPWVRPAQLASNFRNGTGAPYGGMRSSRINGGDANGARRTEPATLQASGGDIRRRSDGLAPRDTTNLARRDASRPNPQSASGDSRPNFDPSNGRIARPAVHGPTDFAARGANSPAARPAMGNARPNFDPSSARPAAHGPNGYQGQSYGRPALSGPTGFAPRGDNRPAVRPSTNYARPTYDRPASNYSRPSYDRPAARPQMNYSRPGAFDSSARPATRNSVGRAPSGHMGGARQAPNAPTRGAGAHRNR